MPTNHPKISAYVPQPVFDRFKQYEKEQGLSMSQAVAAILTQYFDLAPARQKPNPSAAISAEVVNRISSLEQKVERLEKMAMPAPASLNDAFASTSSLAASSSDQPGTAKISFLDEFIPPEESDL